MQTREQNPFLGLKPYESEDWQRLYGRDRDLSLMRDRIVSGRTTLLFAGSGVGKTSFLNVKVIPELEEQEYWVIYHKEWAQEPLAALVNSVIAKLPPDADPSPNLTGSKSLLANLSAFTKPVDVDSPPGKRCVIILDQFEEIFQYHSHETYFARFIEELSELINSDKCNARVLFSMREEFLGELSVFDNKIPDLFSNYYRLKCPTRREAEDIIKRTSGFVNVPVNGDNLKALVHDLAQIKGSEIVAEAAVTAGKTSLERDIVEPPYLQIACQRLWDLQFSSKNGDEIRNRNNGVGDDFLAHYKTGHAHKMLTLFFRENLSSFNRHERALLADAFNYLVTKKGAKMAYELSFLAELMEVQESALEPILVKLSEARILRKSMGRDRSPWFELYHDRYAPIIDEWKRAYRLQRKAGLRRAVKTAGALVVVGALVAVCVWAFGHWVGTPRQNQATLSNANLRDPSTYRANKQAFEKLRDTWGWENQARHLWAEAWKRRAYDAEKQEKPQEALLSWLTAAAEGPSGQEAAMLSQIAPYLTTDDYKSLLASYQFENDSTSSSSVPVFSADGKTLLSVTKDMRVLHWDASSNNLVRKTPPLDDTTSVPDRSGPRQSGNQPPTNAPPDQGPSSDTQIHAAAANLIGGIAKGKFYVWRADTRMDVWVSESNNDPYTQNGAKGEQAYGTARTARLPFISFTPDGHYFATLDPQGVVQVYNVSDKQGIVPTPSRISGVAKVQFSPDNHTLLLLFDNHTLQVRDLITDASRTQKMQSKAIRGVAFSPDGSRFLVHIPEDTGPFSHAEIWDTAKGVLVGTTNQVEGSLVSFNFCADNKMIAASYLSNYEEGKKALTIRFLNSDTRSVEGARTTTFDDPVSYIVNPDGKSILTLAASGIARLWSLTPSKPGDRLIKDSSRILLNNISNDGQVVVTLNQDRIAKIWNAGDASQRGQAFTTSKLDSNQVDVPATYGAVGDELFVSPQGKFSSLRNEDGKFIVWDLKNNREIVTGSIEGDSVIAVSFSPNDEILATAGPGNVIKLWQNLEGDPRSEIINLPQRDAVNRLGFSPDGKYLAAAGYYEGTSLSEMTRPSSFLKVFEVATRKEMKPLDEELRGSAIALRNGKLLTPVVSDDNAVVVWDFVTGQSVRRSHSSTVTASTLSPDGARALTSTSDGSLQLWDTSSGKLIGGIEKYGARIRLLRFSGDGKTAIAFSDNWIHLSSVTDNGLEYQDGQLVRPIGRGVPRFLDPTGRSIRRILEASLNSLEIEDISFSRQTSSPVPGETAARLLEKWTKQLALRSTIAENSRQIPSRPRTDSRF